MAVERVVMGSRLPTRLDRYPAKMVGRLAERLISTYALDATSLLDPFCGSGAILVCAKQKGIPVAGIDLNPIGSLFCETKIRGFCGTDALALCNKVIDYARTIKAGMPIAWDAKTYWFTPATLAKLERLREAAANLRLSESPEGQAVLLALVLSVRTCSRADQRSPKPFISKDAIRTRQGKHYCPYNELRHMLSQLVRIYGERVIGVPFVFERGDISNDMSLPKRIGRYSHVITSPPYINAQDYFRNFKLELYVLENLVPFDLSELRYRFIGTERGDLLRGIPDAKSIAFQKQIPHLSVIKSKSKRLADVVIRYCYDMERAFDMIKECLEPGGSLVLVCGDNLIAGTRFPTWRVLQRMLENRGFVLFDSFTDEIKDRMLAPKRSGHKGIIKEEVVSAFRRP